MSRDYSLGERVDIVGIDTDEEERTCDMHPEGCGRALISVVACEGQEEGGCYRWCDGDGTGRLLFSRVGRG